MAIDDRRFSWVERPDEANDIALDGGSEQNDGAAGSGASGVTGVALGELRSSSVSHDFGAVEVMSSSPQFRWVLENTGPIEIVPGRLTNTNTGDYLAENHCIEPIPPRGSCAILVTFRPTGGRRRPGAFRLHTGADRFASLTVTGRGLVRLTVERNGAGQVTSYPPGIECGLTCTALFEGSERVLLEARTTNGSNSFFSGWRSTELATSRIFEASCKGPIQDCRLQLDGSSTVTANFATMVNNLVFVSSINVAPNLGSLAAYDEVCNRLATEAGINDLSGNGFLAGMSTSTSNLRDRFPAYMEGWVRLDGLAFATSLRDLFDTQNILNPIGFDERGDRASEYASGFEQRVMTGTRADGTVEVDATCGDWTIASAQALTQQGLPGTGGPALWTSGIPIACDSVPFLIQCLGKTKPLGIGLYLPTGKRAWLPNTPYVPGSMTPDAKCTAERPAGVAQGRALIPYTDRPAQAVLDPSATYVRPDGQQVGTGQQIIDQAPISGIWVHANGNYETQVLSRVWTGMNNLTIPLGADVTCDNWTSQAQMGYAAYLQDAGSSFYGNGMSVPCTSTDLYLYCVEP